MFKKIAAFGDCNTLGANSLERKSYPEKIGSKINAEVLNTGHTMATTREGVNLLRDNLGDADCVMIQFGLADSYKTFKYSPYVLYYPDNILRKQFRSIVKKYKKLCRQSGLNALLGEVNVVPSDEYEKNLRTMIEMSFPRKTFLIDTIPNKQLERNSEIKRYNQVLDQLCNEYEHCVKIDLYNVFECGLSQYYQDLTHCNEDGYECIADIIVDKIMGSTAKPQDSC